MSLNKMDHPHLCNATEFARETAKFKMVAALASFLKTPGSLDSVFAVADSVKDGPLGEQALRHLLSDRHFKALVDEGWRPEQIDLQDLQTLPKGSLGRCYADQLISQGITPDTLIDPTPVTNSSEFVVHRVRETHDIVHVLTGFGLDGDSEIGLQGFNLAQNRSPVAVILFLGRYSAAFKTMNHSSHCSEP